MRLNDERIKELKQLLEAEYGLILSDQQAQQAGVAIMRFIVSQYRRQQVLINKELNNEIK